MAEPMPLDRGALCVSIDVEVAWDLPPPIPELRLRQAALEPRIVERLLALFERHDAPATWAIVAGLFDDAPAGDARSGWPWRAPGLVDAIRKSNVPHEIASHSFAHPSFDALSPKDAEADLAQARRVHARHGLPCESLVYPWNRVAHVERAAAAGFRAFRGLDAGAVGWAMRNAPALRPLVNLGTKMAPTAPPLVQPILHRFDAGAIVEVPTSMLLIGRGGARRLATAAAMKRKLRAGARRAARERKLLHLWFHPSNFYDDPDAQLAILDAGLAEARRLADEGRLDLRTMGSFAEGAHG